LAPEISWRRRRAVPSRRTCSRRWAAITARALVVSDPPHLRRLSWVWSKVFAGSGKEFILVASDMDDWDAGHWWRTSPSAQFVFGEYIKLAYYLMQY